MAAVDFSLLSPEELDAVLEMPAMAPPGNETSNFIDPPNQNAMATAIMSVCVAVVVLCLCVRAYARILVLKRVQAQEYLILAAFVLLPSFWSFHTWNANPLIAGVFSGLDLLYLGTMKLTESPGYYVHTWNVKLRQTVDMGLLVHIAGIFYSVCLPLLKSSILVEWIGVFVPGSRNWFFWTCWVLIGVQVAFAIAAVVALNLVCIPAQKKWEFWLPGTCINAHTIETVSASFQLMCDCIILALPQKPIWDLQMGWKKKIAVSIIFSLGVFACVSAAFRLAVTIQYASAEDAIYYIGPVCFWAYAEMTCGFIVVCLPCVPKIVMESGLWRRLRKGLGLKVTGVTGGATGGSGVSGATPKNRTLSGTGRSKNKRSANDSYLEIDETELKTFGSESTEHLRESTVPAGQLDKGIVRTTEVFVTDANGREGGFDRPTQWRYRGTN